jgi:hypothetical protein
MRRRLGAAIGSFKHDAIAAVMHGEGRRAAVRDLCVVHTQPTETFS